MKISFYESLDASPFHTIDKDDLAKSIGKFIKPIWPGISRSEIVKLFLTPYAQIVFNQSIKKDVQIYLHYTNSSDRRLLETFDCLPGSSPDWDSIDLDIVISKENSDDALISLLLSNKYSLLGKYFANYTVDDILRFPCDQLIRIVKDSEKLLTLEFYEEIQKYQ